MPRCEDCGTPGWVQRLVGLRYLHVWVKLDDKGSDGGRSLGVWFFRWRFKRTAQIIAPDSSYRYIFRRWYVVGPFEVREFMTNEAGRALLRSEKGE